MTQTVCDRGIWGRWNPICLVLTAVLTGCVSASLEDAAPTQPLQQAPTEATEEKRDNSFVQDGARRSGSYPTFERTPIAATDQLSETDQQRLESEMESVRAAYGAGAISEARYRERMRELERLARTHGADAQREIEN